MVTREQLEAEKRAAYERGWRDGLEAGADKMDDRQAEASGQPPGDGPRFVTPQQKGAADAFCHASSSLRALARQGPPEPK